MLSARRLQNVLLASIKKAYNPSYSSYSGEFLTEDGRNGLWFFQNFFGIVLEFPVTISERVSSGNGHRYCFDGFEVDPTNRELRRDGVVIPLRGKVFDVLLVFAENPDRLLSKDELIEKVWNEDFVEEGNLARNVSTLRKVLGDTGREHKYIATIPGHGYRFIASPPKPAAVTLEAPPSPPSTGGSVRWIFILGVGAIAAFIAVGFAVTRLSNARTAELFGERPAFRRLTSSGRVLKLALSRDGNLIAFAAGDKNGETLFVRQTDVSNEVALASVKGHISCINFSPDSKLIYYSVFRGDASEGDLHSVPILGGVSKTYPGLSVLDFSLAPDGYHFAGVTTSRDRGESALVIDDLGNEHEKELTKREYPSDFSAGDTKVAWAPDGTSIAAVVNENSSEVPFSTVILVDPETGEENAFTRFHWTYIDSIEWVSDSRSLMVAGSDSRGEPSQIFAVSLDGAVRKLTDGVNNYSLAAANVATRSLVSLQTTRSGSIWSGQLAHLSNGSAELTSGSGTLEPLSVVGSDVVFRASGIGGSELWSVSQGGGEKRPLTRDAGVDRRGLCSTPDRRLVFSSARSGKNNLWRLDPDDGSLHQLTNGENEIFPACTPDGKWVVFQRMASTNQKTSLWKVGIDGGEPQQLTDYFAVRPSISPDGKWIAAFYMDDPNWKIGLISVDGGKLQRSFDLPSGMTDRIARWSPDGRALLLVGNYGDLGNIWRIPIDGSAAEKVTDLDQQNIEDFVVLPLNGGVIFSRSTTISDAFIAIDK